MKNKGEIIDPLDIATFFGRENKMKISWLFLRPQMIEMT